MRRSTRRLLPRPGADEPTGAERQPMGRSIMLVTKLRVDGQVYFLPPEIDQARLQQQIVAAVKSGAEFVEFDTHGHGQVSVLMTPYIPVRFERVERTEEEIASWEATPPSYEFEDLEHFGD